MHLNLRLKCTIVITRYPSSVVVEVSLSRAPKSKAQEHYRDHALSVVRPSLTFTFSTSNLKPLKRIRQQLTGSKISMSPASDWQGQFPLKPLNGIQRNLTESKIWMSLPSLILSGRSENKLVAAAPDWLRHFYFSSETTKKESNITWQKARSAHFLPYLCFGADWWNKMAAPTAYWLRQFRLLLNRRTEFNGTWQEAISQRPLPSLCISGRSEKQNGRPWLAETFLTSPLKSLNGIQRNLTGSKILTSYTTFVFSGR